MSLPDTISRLLFCSLTEDELAARAQELAKAEHYRNSCELELDAAAEEWKERKKELEAKILVAAGNCVRLARVVEDGKEERDVECGVLISGSNYTLFRKDTGEVVIVRPATQSELQQTLDLEPEPPLDPIQSILEEPLGGES